MTIPNLYNAHLDNRIGSLSHRNSNRQLGFLEGPSGSETVSKLLRSVQDYSNKVLQFSAS